ncbi:MAG: hypothetical protein VXY92_04025, partial [Planctomycetota bacterium]|nr:hypothetical protein [Planctomycetota bacterium]
MNARFRALSLLVSALLLVGGAWWWATADGSVALPSQQANSAPAHADSADLAGADLAAASAANLAAQPALEREVPESLFQAADDAANGLRAITIQVWDRVEGTPADGAEVFVMNSAEADWKITQGPFAVHWSSVAERRGRRFRTDSAGQVEVSGFANNSVVVAKAQGAYAFKWVGEVAEEGHVEVLTMTADESVTIKVVDERGAPVAGAAVGIVERIPLAGSMEELQARADQMEAWVTGLRQWMSENPKGAAEAGDKLGGLQDALRETRQELAVARAEQERRSQQGASSDQAPLSRLEVRTRRLTDEMGLAVVD